ncbi:hypothetical protein DQG23_29045 [Paenibacillus contaminans]|uniref:Uncharacterized protein n=1 Tax=Paenibacillus contaminans TaxID=450362 RepID=A0A329M8K7_9BACL|nr:hypothetical protein DQG23_29045 [Paenibacillus contaminans]
MSNRRNLQLGVRRIYFSENRFTSFAFGDTIFIISGRNYRNKSESTVRTETCFQLKRVFFGLSDKYMAEAA